VKLFGGGRRDEAPSRIYDRVLVLADDGSTERTLRPEDFDGLGLDERVRLILGKKLRFYSGQTEVPVKEALRDPT
jgi:hypothetical protein